MLRVIKRVLHKARKRNRAFAQDLSANQINQSGVTWTHAPHLAHPIVAVQRHEAHFTRLWAD